MNTRPKRKYGEVKKAADTTQGTNQSVFDKFLPAEEKTVPSTPPSTRPSTPARHPSPPDVAPKRDFQKVANSITREAVPAGVFNGKAKQLYDCLYSLTRGAIVPSMTVRISRADLMKKSGIGAKVTLEQNLRRLALSGLISIKTIGGIQGGNEYTVKLPEETIPSTPPSTGTSLPSPPSPPSNGENLGALAPLETSPPRYGLNAGYQTTYEDSKTSFKTIEENSDDDAHARRFTAKMVNAERELTGRISTSDEKWEELAEVLVSELRIAAARTTVSNVPAFLAEHLRRRLWKVDKARATEMAAGGEVAQGQEVRGELSDEKRKMCPDCAGVGFWYPEGPDKGVAKCKHLRLISVPTEAEGA